MPSLHRGWRRKHQSQIDEADCFADEVAVCPAEMIGGNASREIAVIPFTKEILPKYDMYVLAAPVNQTTMIANVRGTAYLGINLADIRTLPIPVPSIKEQERVVFRLEIARAKIEDLKMKQSHRSAELNALMPSILDTAFRGEL